MRLAPRTAAFPAKAGTQASKRRRLSCWTPASAGDADEKVDRQTRWRRWPNSIVSISPSQ